MTSSRDVVVTKAVSSPANPTPTGRINWYARPGDPRLVRQSAHAASGTMPALPRQNAHLIQKTFVEEQAKTLEVTVEIGGDRVW